MSVSATTTTLIGCADWRRKSAGAGVCSGFAGSSGLAGAGFGGPSGKAVATGPVTRAARV
jgi:hypothetical protein